MQLRSSTVKKRSREESTPRESLVQVGNRPRQAILALSPNLIMDRIHSSRPSARTARNADPSTRTSETAQVNIPSKPVFKQDSPQDTTPAPNTAQPLTSY